MKDIFENPKIELPETVVILGCGPLGLGGSDVRPVAFVIALNKAVLLRSAADIWFCSEVELNTESWFVGTLSTGCRGAIPVLHRGLAQAVRNKVPESAFKGETYLRTSEERWCRELPYGSLRLGGTVAGEAIQFAWHFGAKHIVLCGVDMYGNESLGSEPYTDRAGVWSQCENINELISYLSGLGMRFSTLTPTMAAVGGRG